MPLASLFHRSRRRAAALLYQRIVEQARDPLYFTAWGVPDTLDGRFEVLSLHAFLVLNRLKAEHARTAELAQDLFDTMFADLDRAMRELGASDLGVGRHVKTMAAAFYGRVVAYDQGLAEGDRALEDALARNLFGGAATERAQLGAASLYMRRQVQALRGVSIDTLMAGEVSFAPGEAQ